MGPEGIAFLAFASTWLLVALGVFGVVVVRRRDPSPHAVMLGSFALAVVTYGASLAAMGRTETLLRFLQGAFVFSSLGVALLLIAWGLAVTVRPGEPVEVTSRTWVHGAWIVGTSIAVAGMEGSAAALLWWFPNLLHVALAYRDGARLRRAWGDIASIAFGVTATWVATISVRGHPDPTFYAFAAALLGHHVLAMVQARHARPAVWLWPLLAVVTVQVLEG